MKKIRNLKNSLFRLDLRQGWRQRLCDVSVGRRHIDADVLALRLQLVDERVDVFGLAAQFHRLRVDHRLPEKKPIINQKYKFDITFE